MTTLEIVRLRAVGKPIAILSTQIAETVESTSSNTVTIYRRTGLDTDLAVHIRTHEAASTSERSAVGTRLASELRAYGIVEHTVWTEMDKGRGLQ